MLIAISSGVLALGYVHWWWLKRSFKSLKGLSFNGSEWFLLDAQGHKVMIELLANTRRFKHWVLLHYRHKSPHSTKRFKRSSLWLPRDCFADKDYRDLSRTLGFIS
ncbi:hypothetical protein [Kangiella sp. TOML190]|uniref:hypothetical protein n=1 Tax=Kangiella sp. TOML190 TaxID=2931351 RepID=UPI00203FB896|nr:hypothetical protein [Kangiella sp. TOML190]